LLTDFPPYDPFARHKLHELHAQNRELQAQIDRLTNDDIHTSLTRSEQLRHQLQLELKDAIKDNKTLANAKRDAVTEADRLRKELKSEQERLKKDRQGGDDEAEKLRELLRVAERQLQAALEKVVLSTLYGSTHKKLLNYVFL
jgi:chromosome segregation ATPase